MIVHPVNARRSEINGVMKQKNTHGANSATDTPSDAAVNTAVAFQGMRTPVVFAASSAARERFFGAGEGSTAFSSAMITSVPTGGALRGSMPDVDRDPRVTMSRRCTPSTKPGRLPYRSKTDLVTEFLRAEIEARRPGPGERVVVSRIAEQLGVSKIPVREAVTHLTGEGLLMTLPHVGPIVPAFSAHEVRETALMRVAVENAALSSAISHHDEESIRRVDSLIEQMRASDAPYPWLNVEFHLAVIDPSPYRDMVKLAESLLKKAQRYATVHVVPWHRETTHEEHERIAELILAKDVDNLRALNDHHVMSAAQQLIDHMQS